jgi:hypothetical protein
MERLKMWTNEKTNQIFTILKEKDWATKINNFFTLCNMHFKVGKPIITNGYRWYLSNEDGIIFHFNSGYPEWDEEVADNIVLLVLGFAEGYKAKENQIND